MLSLMDWDPEEDGFGSSGLSSRSSIGPGGLAELVEAVLNEDEDEMPISELIKARSTKSTRSFRSCTLSAQAAPSVSVSGSAPPMPSYWQSTRLLYPSQQQLIPMPAPKALGVLQPQQSTRHLTSMQVYQAKLQQLAMQQAARNRPGPLVEAIEPPRSLTRKAGPKPWEGRPVAVEPGRRLLDYTEGEPVPEGPAERSNPYRARFKAMLRELSK